jgi:hypothetical protein
VDKELTGRENGALGNHPFQVLQEPDSGIEQVIETAALILGSDRSRGYCLEMICADFIAGADLENRNPETLLFSMTRFFKFLPRPQQQASLQEILAQAS